MATTRPLRTYDDGFLRCRKNHLMDRVPYDGYGPVSWHTTKSTAIVQYDCLRCGRKTYYIWSRVTGDIIQTSTRYPKGYLLRGKDPKRRHHVRKELMTRDGI